MKTIQVVIFDLDGTLVDSEPASRRVWEAFLNRFGHTLSDTVYAQMIGRRKDVSIQLVKDRFALPLSPSEILHQRSQLSQQLGSQPLLPMLGLGEVMDVLRRYQCPWGVATSSQREYAEKVLKDLGIWAECRALATGDDVAHGKPAPDLFLLAAEQLGVAAETCLAVEDSAAGCESALSAGMTVVAIPNPIIPVQTFPPVHHFCRSLVDLAQFWSPSGIFFRAI